MAKTQRAKEGYLMMDHRGTPGLDLPGNIGQGLFEAPTITCSHCQAVFMVNPQRTRERAFCRKCDHYICDACGAILHDTGICRPFAKVLDDAQELAARGLIIPQFTRNPNG
jgi:hypothetical protein